MSLSDEIERLQRLRQSGALTDEEFARAKAAVLDASLDARPEPSPASEEHLRQIELQNELARLDREWDMEREQYMSTTKYGEKYVPTEGGSIGGAVFSVLVGGGWTAFASSIGAPWFFSIFGVLVMVAGVASAISSLPKVDGYKQAHERYLQRRAQLLAEQRHR